MIFACQPRSATIFGLRLSAGISQAVGRTSSWICPSLTLTALSGWIFISGGAYPLAGSSFLVGSNPLTLACTFPLTAAILVQFSALGRELNTCVLSAIRCAFVTCGVQFDVSEDVLMIAFTPLRSFFLSQILTLLLHGIVGLLITSLPRLGTRMEFCHSYSRTTLPGLECPLRHG